MLRHESHRVPVTALGFSDRHLFAGQGPLLKVHGRDDGNLLVTHKAFAWQAIHGIVVSDAVIIVWGGHFISLFRLETSGTKCILELTSTLRAQDWILDISISPFSSRSRPHAAVLTAHNALLLLDLDPSHTSGPILTHLTSTSRCILYSANLHWLDPDHILIASGTVFGEIILWSCFLQARSSPTSVLHQLISGHEGSIFGVRILDSPRNGTAERVATLLASCSDDRTVRLWDISDLPDTPMDPQAAADMRSARETGFGVNIADALPDQAAAGRCIATAWGHASRIWDVRFLPSEVGDESTYLVSFGEDATTQFWKFVPPSSTDSPDAGHLNSLEHIAKAHVHSGKNIWSSAVTTSVDQQITIATGGADGSVVLSKHSMPVKSVSDTVQSWSIEGICSTAPTEAIKTSDKLRGFAFVNETSIIVSTNSGNVFLIESAASHVSKGNTEPRCRWISQETRLRGYSVVTSLSSLSLAFLAGMDGTVLMYQNNDLSRTHELTKCSGKTTALFARELSIPDNSGRNVCLLVTNIESKQATLLLLSTSSHQSDQAIFKVAAEWTVILPTHFTVTGCLVVSTPGDGSFTLILGSRDGAVAVFQIPQHHAEKYKTPVSHNLILDRVHGRDAVTDLAWVANQTSDNARGHIFSVGRDGSFAILRLSEETSNALEIVNQTSLPAGMIIEGLYITEDEQSVVCWGFQSKQFVVVDLLKEKETMTVDCGGANRLWKFEPSRLGAGLGTFAWIKASQLCLSAQNQAPPTICDGGGHGREVKAVAVRPSQSSDDRRIFATGSEDTNIKICEYNNHEPGDNQTGKSDFHCIRTLRKHNTGIQNLQWSSDGRYLFSSGGFEELFVWRARPAPLVGIGLVCESVCPAESDMPDLRIMSFAARQQQTNLAVEDTRHEEVFIVSMVRSDSTLRIYSYTSLSRFSSSSLAGKRRGVGVGGGEWRLLSAGNYLTSCLTQCLDLSYRHGRILLTAGTDGHVALWPLHQAAATTVASGNDGDMPEPEALNWTSRHKIHQNAIHSISVHWIEKDRDCVLITGGDDSSFAVTRCTWSSENAGTNPETSTLLVPRAHAAATTGLEVLRPEVPTTAGDSSNLVISIATTGLDQQLKIWDLRIDAAKPGVEGFEVAKVQEEFTPVADPSDMAVFESRTGRRGGDGRRGSSAILICGVGLDVWRVQRRGNCGGDC